ncbi:hypothetical protein HNR62_000337 [Oceanisphaera litoralis]|uniref:3'-5' exonuclease n=1 Tax=Oceanisphaera litoralis TaxID=225144 RepID=UPI001955FA5E|nr:3'-5' exonuclease [Oceanisphaera litoralis]MBM7454508.1 hypothetical protein [Oceanisphaera litoralis]
MKDLLHISLDLETLNTAPDAVITSIAAIPFTMELGVSDCSWYGHLSIQEQLNAGRTASASTLLWWLRQEDVAREELVQGQEAITRGLRDELATLLDFVALEKQRSNIDTVAVWGNGSTFDVTLLEHLLRQNGLTPFWDYRHVYDMRTLVALNPAVKERNKNNFVGVRHNAFADATHQANVISETWKSIQQ